MCVIRLPPNRIKPYSSWLISILLQSSTNVKSFRVFPQSERVITLETTHPVSINKLVQCFVRHKNMMCRKVPFLLLYWCTHNKIKQLPLNIRKPVWCLVEKEITANKEINLFLLYFWLLAVLRKIHINIVFFAGYTWNGICNVKAFKLTNRKWHGNTSLTITINVPNEIFNFQLFLFCSHFIIPLSHISKTVLYDFAS